MLPKNDNYPDIDAMPFTVECPSDLIEGYFEALLKCVPNEEEFEGISPSLAIAGVALCERFFRANEGEIEEGEENEEFTYDKIGSDLYMTTNHTGVGFWEDDYPRSKIFQSWVDGHATSRDCVSEYVGDDGMLYSMAGDMEMDLKALQIEFPEAFA